MTTFVTEKPVGFDSGAVAPPEWSRKSDADQLAGQ